MAKLSKKTLAIVLSATFVALAFVVVAVLFAVGAFDGNKSFVYREVSGGYEVAEYVGKSKNVIVPSKVKGKTVVGIGDGAFYSSTKNKAITSVVLPASLEYIGKNAFASCESLSSIVIPKKTTSIGENAFLNCKSLVGIAFEENSELETFGANAISGTAALSDILSANKTLVTLDQILIGSSVPVYDLVVPNYVRVVADSAFAGSGSLQTVFCKEGSQLVSVGDSAFAKCANLEKADFSNAESLNLLGKSAFFECRKLVYAGFADGLCTCEQNCFNSCSVLRSVDFGAGTVEFGNDSLAGCVALDSIRFSANCKNIEGALSKVVTGFVNVNIVVSGGLLDDAFAAQVGDRTRSLVIEEGAAIAKSGLANFSKLWKLQIPAKVLSSFYDIGIIADGSLFDLVLTGNGTSEDVLNVADSSPFKWARSIALEGVTEICDKAFNSCINAKNVTWDDSLVKCGNSCFLGTGWLEAMRGSTQTVVCGDTLVLASASAFSSQRIVIAEGVTKIDSHAISCPKLTLPSTIVEIAANAKETTLKTLDICFRLSKETGTSKIKKIGDKAFFGLDSFVVSTEVEREDGTFASNGSSFVLAEIEEVGENIAPILASDAGKLVTFGGTVLVGAGEGYVGSNSALFVPVGVKIVAKNAFLRVNTSITRVVISRSVEKIGEKAFAGLVAVRDVDISASTVEILSKAFANVDGGRIVCRNTSVCYDILSVFDGFSGDVFVDGALVDEYEQKDLDGVTIIGFGKGDDQ